MSKEKEYWQCGHTRKCKWVGVYEDLDSVKNTDHPEIEMTDSICPKCGNKEFYTLNEQEYQKLQNKQGLIK